VLSFAKFMEGHVREMNEGHWDVVGLHMRQGHHSREVVQYLM